MRRSEYARGVLFILLFISNLIYGQDKVNKIEISYVNWGITVFSLVNCDEFDDAFNVDSIKKKYSITEPLIIRTIERKISKVIQDQRLNDYDAVDTRLKMRFYCGRELIKTVCIGTIAIQIDNVVYSGVVDTDPDVEELRNLLDRINTLYMYINQNKD